MKYFSLFSGVGGFEIGIEKAYVDSRGHAGERGSDVGGMSGAEVVGTHAPLAACVGFSEIDRHASAVLRHRFPNVKNYGDITKIDWAAVPDFDLLVGGSPCQDMSVAGKRAGLGGERSGLFHEYVRALQEKKPRHFVWENVRGALSSNAGRDFAVILDAFSEAGYSLWWQVLNARDFGVPQNRERVFVVGTRSDLGSAREIFFEAGDRGEDIVKAIRANYGNGFAPKRGKRGDKPVIFEPPRGGYSGSISDENSPSLRTATYRNTGILDETRVRRLMPVETERLMSWPDDWTKYGTDESGAVTETSDTQRYKMCGNGVVSAVVAEVIKAHVL